MTEKEQKQNAKKFAEFWEGKGYEKGQSQVFWYSLLNEVLDVESPKSFIEFEDQVHIDKSTGFIDGYIPKTKVLIEQKSVDKDLRKAIKQSDGSLLTPFQQAKKYIAELPVSRHPRWVITCNFREFYIYDMEKPNGEPEILLLKNLEKEYYRLQFIVDSGNENLKREMEISIQAGELVGKLYDEILPLYKNPENEDTLRSLNKLCVRLVFCLYAEDAGIFGKHQMFHDYLNKFNAEDLRVALLNLFTVLDTKVEDRDPYLKNDLAQFPYVNGGLFSDENIEIPMLNENVRNILLLKASEDFDWSEISPTIFGAIFESTLNPETRRSGGMHYTSIENIHKVIDPLFLNDLKSELEENILNIKTRNVIEKNVKAFQDKISNLNFLDPACGSGNFLTETYISLRKMENRALEKLYGDQIQLADVNNPIRVSIKQFYGIEINDFAVTVAKTALWIAESQMLKATEDILHMNLDFLPLKSYTNIVEGNALQLDWNEVINKNECNYIMGNPPFVGKKYQTKEQKADLNEVFKSWKGIGNLDFVCCWYKKALDYIQNNRIKSAFVSTNSIVQGEHVPLFWKPLYEKYNINIIFAYRTFKWNSEAKEKAAVHCVIIGFANYNVDNKYLFINDSIVNKANNIHPYLIDMPNIFVENRSTPVCDVPPLVYGSFALDDGNYTISDEEYKSIIEKEPSSSKFLKLFIGSEEFINNKKRYCVWLKNADISEIRKSNIIMNKIQNVKNWRLTSSRKETLKAAETPMEFAEIRQPDDDYLAIPITSSEKRKYIPMGYMNKDIIASNHLLVLPNANYYYFGILESNVHMAWMRTVCGRMKSDYNYSARVVYNNFPFPNPTEEQKNKIEKTAQLIISARELYSSSSLADLYDELTMPVELRKAHQENDKAVMEAYGFDWRKMSESDCVAELMKMYQKLTNEDEKMDN